MSTIREEMKVENRSVFEGWVDAAKQYTPGVLNDCESAQFERAESYEEHSKRFDFVLGGKLFLGK